MKRRMNSLFTCILAICFLFALAANCAAVDKTKISVPVSAAAKNFFEARGVMVSESARMKLVEVTAESGESGYALCLTQINNGLLTSEYFASMKKVQDNSDGSTRMAIEKTFSYDFPFASWDDRFVIHATATWFVYDNGYKRPVQVEWDYEKYDTSINVSHILVGYYCSGGLYSYPAFDYLNTNITHTIEKSVNNPSIGTTYRNYNPLSPTRAIDSLAGYPNGQYLGFKTIVNGVESELYTVTIQQHS